MELTASFSHRNTVASHSVPFPGWHSECETLSFAIIEGPLSLVAQHFNGPLFPLTVDYSGLFLFFLLPSLRIFHTRSCQECVNLFRTCIRTLRSNFFLRPFAPLQHVFLVSWPPPLPSFIVFYPFLKPRRSSGATYKRPWLLPVWEAPPLFFKISLFLLPCGCRHFFSFLLQGVSFLSSVLTGRICRIPINSHAPCLEAHRVPLPRHSSFFFCRRFTPALPHRA